MSDNVDNETTPLEISEVNDNGENIEQLDVEEAIEVVDIGEPAPEDVDLKLGDEPFEIGIDAVEKMKLEEEAAKQDNSSDDGDAAAGGEPDKGSKDVMLKNFNDIMDAFDKTRIFILITALIAIVGSFFVFCEIQVGDIPAQSIGNFFNGFSGSIISNILSKLSIIAVIATVILAAVNLKKASIFTMLAAILTFIIQCVFFVVWGSVYYAISMTCFRPGIGSVIMLAALLLMLIGVLKNKRTVVKNR